MENETNEVDQVREEVIVQPQRRIVNEEDYNAHDLEELKQRAECMVKLADQSKSEDGEDDVGGNSAITASIPRASANT